MRSPYECSKLGLVVPTLNEVENIRPLLVRVRAALDPTNIPYEILVVDDGSSDGTQQVVRQYASTDPRISLLERSGARGLAGAIIYGWKHTDADLLAVMDADLQHPPELLPMLLAGIEAGHDIAIGSRYANGNGVSGWNPLRHMISRVLTWVTVPFQRRNLQVADPMSGFFLVKRECIDGIDLQRDGFKILFEILVRGRIKCAIEVPFEFGIRLAGKSKADVKVAYHYFTLLRRLSRDLLQRSEAQ